AIGVLALVHYVLQSKLDVAEASAAAGLFLWLMSYRLLAPLGRDGAVPVWGLLLLGLGIGLATTLGEAYYHALAHGVDPRRVLAADLHWPFLGRPGWVVLLTGLGLGLLALLRRPRALAGRGQMVDAAA